MRLWADERHASLFTGACEWRPLGEKAVTWVNSLSPRFLGDFQNLVDSKITLGASCGPNTVGLVCISHMKGFAVWLGVNGHRLNPHLSESSHDSDRDLTAIRH